MDLIHGIYDLRRTIYLNMVDIIGPIVVPDRFQVRVH